MKGNSEMRAAAMCKSCSFSARCCKQWRTQQRELRKCKIIIHVKQSVKAGDNAESDDTFLLPPSAIFQNRN